MTQKLGKGYSSNLKSGALKELTAGLKVMIFKCGIHGIVITGIM